MLCVSPNLYCVSAKKNHAKLLCRPTPWSCRHWKVLGLIGHLKVSCGKSLFCAYSRSDSCRQQLSCNGIQCGCVRTTHFIYIARRVYSAQLPLIHTGVLTLFIGGATWGLVAEGKKDTLDSRAARSHNWHHNVRRCNAGAVLSLAP